MKKIGKEIGKYLLILIMLVILLSGLMLLTIVTIPREKMESNIEASILALKSPIEVKRMKPERYSTYLHVYADEMLLNIIYCIDTSKPLESMLEANYYQDEIKPNLEKAVKTKSNGNTEYIRYWHGSMTMIRPLLIFFNITQIYYIFAIILCILAIILFILLMKRKQYLLLIATIIGFIMTSSIYVPFCLEYVWTYLIMLMATILAIKLENKKQGNSYINTLMFITGIMTCFLDFLSTETITFLIPILFIFTIRNKEDRLKDLKAEIKQIVIWIFLWLAGYAAMWIAKWLLASLILHINALEYVTDKAMVRINGKLNEDNMKAMIVNGIKKNFLTISPFYQIKEPIIGWGILSSILVALILLAKRNKKELEKAVIVLGLGIIPYIRYMILASHSRGHYFFTFRAQIATVIAIIIAIAIMIDRDRLKKEIKIKHRKNKEKQYEYKP